MKNISVLIFLWTLLTSCSKPSENLNTTASITPWPGPLLFWEGQMRVHALQWCDARWQITSADIWQKGQIELACPNKQTLRLNNEIENKHVVEPIEQWLGFPFYFQLICHFRMFCNKAFPRHRPGSTGCNIATQYIHNGRFL
jgi:hypothetical protein